MHTNVVAVAALFSSDGSSRGSRGGVLQVEGALHRRYYKKGLLEGLGP
jgi:hypothetical protein